MIFSSLFVINVIMIITTTLAIMIMTERPIYDCDCDHYDHFHPHCDDDDDAEQPFPGRVEGRTFSPLWLACTESSQGGHFF